MTRIVHDNFPVERLPEELRAALGNATHVRLTMEDKGDDDAQLAELDVILARASAEVREGSGYTADEVRARLRSRREKDMKRAS